MVNSNKEVFINYHKHSSMITVIQWQNKSYTGNIYDNITMIKYNQGVYFMNYANILLQKTKKTYQYKHIYNDDFVTE